jgi:hypothetical protein
MARFQFVHPHTDVLTLSHGATVTVRRVLNQGEFRAVFRACHDAVTPDGGSATVLLFDPTKHAQMKTAGYLVDWTFEQWPPIRGASLLDKFTILDNLEPADMVELRDAIDRHEARQVAARLEEKKEAPTPTVGPT